MNNKLFKTTLVIIAIVLLIPLIAMQFTDEVNWNYLDFFIAAILLFGAGLGINFIIIKVDSKKRRVLLIIFLLMFFILIWAELGVGIFGTPFAGY